MTYEHEREERSYRLPRRVSAPYPAASVLHWGMFETYLHARGLSPELARANKWYPSVSAGDAVPRIVIPATNSMGQGFWQARAMVAAEKRYQSPAVMRGDSVVVMWPSTTPTKLVVVEGPMDALAAAECGCVGVGLMGNTPPPMVINFVSTLSYSLPVLVVGDSDALREASKIAGALAIRGRKTNIRMLHGAKDLAELPLSQRVEQLIG